MQQAGHAFCLALTSEGEVLGWGRNDQGQLGLGGGLTMVSLGHGVMATPKQNEAYTRVSVAWYKHEQ